MAVERPDVERRGRLAAEAVVPCRCTLMLMVWEVEDWRECEEDEGMREWAVVTEGASMEVRTEFAGGRVLEERVREWW